MDSQMLGQILAPLNAWLERDTLGEGGPDYAEATRRCLFCAFGPKSTDLEDIQLRAAIYPEVVKRFMMGGRAESN